MRGKRGETILLEDYTEEEIPTATPPSRQTTGFAGKRAAPPQLLSLQDGEEEDEEEIPTATPPSRQTTGFAGKRAAPPQLLSLQDDKDEDKEPTSPDVSSDASVGDSGSEESKAEEFKIPYSIFKMKDSKDRDKFIIVYPIKLGKGNFGTVKLAQELILTTKEDGIEQLVAGDIIVVKKSLRKSRARTGLIDKGEIKDHTTLFQTEKEANKRLLRLQGALIRDTQNDALEYNGKLYLAMDFIEGSSLSDFIKSPDFNDQQKLQALLAALTEYQINTQQNNFVAHGDFHIGNILIGLNPITAEIIDLSFVNLDPNPSESEKRFGQSQDIVKLGQSIIKCCSENKINFPKLIAIAEQMANTKDTHTTQETIYLIKRAINPTTMPTPIEQTTTRSTKTSAAKNPSSTLKQRPQSPPPSLPASPLNRKK